ncbi:beta glucosidase 46, partial [Tanacetum coccineum]
DRVKYWVTLNKPYVDAAYGYRSGIYPLARCSASLGNYTSGDFKSEPYIAAHNMILSHAAVEQEISAVKSTEVMLLK